jgi:hypothetical protein
MQTTQPHDYFDHELRAYVEAFKTSSDRSRYAIYVIVVATVLIFIANWNVQDWSWPSVRLRAWYQPERPAKDKPAVNAVTPQGLNPIQRSPAPTEFFNGDAEQLRIARDEYLRQFTSRTLLTPSPIPGVSIDVNDLGLIGGISLALLLLLLCFSLNRQHENLYLALFKVRRISEGEDHSRGDSRSNLLYHALAMTQVLSFPPTLALWRRRTFQDLFGIIYFLPTLVYVWLVYTNVVTFPVGNKYHGVNILLLTAIQIGLAVSLLSLSLWAWAEVRAMSKRWESAFFRINPGRRVAPQMTTAEWLKLPWHHAGDRLRQKMTSQLVDCLSKPEEYKIDEITCEAGLTICGSKVVRNNVRQVIEDLINDGTAKATQCAQDRQSVFLGLENFAVKRDELIDKRWFVSGIWTFRYATTPIGNPDATPHDGQGRPAAQVG